MPLVQIQLADDNQFLTTCAVIFILQGEAATTWPIIWLDTKHILSQLIHEIVHVREPLRELNIAVRFTALRRSELVACCYQQGEHHCFQPFSSWSPSHLHNSMFSCQRQDPQPNRPCGKVVGFYRARQHGCIPNVGMSAAS